MVLKCNAGGSSLKVFISLFFFASTQNSYAIYDMDRERKRFAGILRKVWWHAISSSKCSHSFTWERKTFICHLRRVFCTSTPSPSLFRLLTNFLSHITFQVFLFSLTPPPTHVLYTLAFLWLLSTIRYFSVHTHTLFGAMWKTANRNFCPSDFWRKLSDIIHLISIVSVSSI